MRNRILAALIMMGFSATAGLAAAEEVASDSTSGSAAAAAPTSTDGGSTSSATLGADAALSATVAAESPKKAYSLDFVIDHYPEGRDEFTAFTDFALDGSYRFGETHRLRVVQAMTREYEKTPGASEFLAQDTVIYHYMRLAKGWKGLDWQLRSGLTLPISLASNHNSVISGPNVALIASRKFLGDRLSVSYYPTYRYQINRYKTTVGGNPLRQHSLGHVAAAAYSINDKWSVQAQAAGYYHWNERNRYSQEAPRRNSSYRFDFITGYQVTKTVGTAFGYIHSDSAFKEGRTEIFVYDPLISRFYFELSASL